MGTRRECHFGIADVLSCHIRAKLVGDQLVILDRSQAAGDIQINLDEVVKIAKDEPFLHVFNSVYRQVNPIPLCQDEQRRRLYRPFQVNVQFGFGSRLQIGL